MMRTTHEILHLVRDAYNDAQIHRFDKDRALLSIADELEAHEESILLANVKDLQAAQDKYSEVMLDRLRLTSDRIKDMAKGVREVAALEDPEGKELSSIAREDGLIIKKISAPFGIIAIIYESRPNVTSDAAALALKSGNAAVLRGGSEAYYSNKAIVDALQAGLKKARAPLNLIGFIEDRDRRSAQELMCATGLVDLLIPRGGAGLIQRCVNDALVPVIQTGTGICHAYIDKSASLSMALDIVENGKMSRPSVCNALEVVLVHKDIADQFLPLLKKRLVDERKDQGMVPLTLLLCERSSQIIDGSVAKDGDFDKEHLDYILSIAIVDSIDQAIEHIGKHSTAHSDVIVTEDDTRVRLFVRLVDSAAVYVNASSRFTDGGQFGLGCEMGISTQKLHARGPLGLEELTTYKYVIYGKGHTR